MRHVLSVGSTAGSPCVGAGLAVLVLAAGASCSSDIGPVTPAPITVDLSTGAMLAPISIATNGTGATSAEPFYATIDTMSPITVLLPERPTTVRQAVTMTIHDLVTGVPRIEFGVSAFSLIPCPSQEPVPEPCVVGMDGVTREIRGIIGADVLSRGAARFDFGQGTVSFLPNIAGESRERAAMCEAVFAGPFYGGGTAVIGDTEVSYNGQRIALGGCFFDAKNEQACGETSPCTGPEQGLDALFLLATGLSHSVLSRNIYEQYRASVDECDRPPEFTSLPEATLYLPSGPMQVRLSKVKHLALVAEESDERGPCQERYVNHLMLCNEGGCRAPAPADMTDEDGPFSALCPSPESADSEAVCRDPAMLACPNEGKETCPCDNNATFCRAGAVVNLYQEMDVAVVDYGNPLLQALRQELRPELPELSGVLNAQALSALVVDVDYPKNRVLMRCTDPTVCQIRPGVTRRDDPSAIAMAMACGAGFCDPLPATNTDPAPIDAGVDAPQSFSARSQGF